MTRRRVMGNEDKYKLPKGCVAWYLFLEDDLGKDSSPNQNHASVLSGVSYLDPPSDKHLIGGCASFTSNKSYIQIPNNPYISFNQDSEFSLEFWFNYRRVLNISRFYLICKQNRNSFEYAIRKSADYQVLEYGLSSMDMASGESLSSYFVYDTWIHNVFTFNKGVCVLYTDGVSYRNNTQSITQGTGSLFIGNNYQKGVSFQGIINNLRIYNRVLSAEEVLQHYNKEK